jgi:hypothetical protein
MSEQRPGKELDREGARKTAKSAKRTTQSGVVWTANGAKRLNKHMGWGNIDIIDIIPLNYSAIRRKHAAR